MGQQSVRVRSAESPATISVNKKLLPVVFGSYGYDNDIEP